MSFNIIDASKKITGQYRRYLRTSFDIMDPEYRALLDGQLENNAAISKGPYLEVVDSFKAGARVADLVGEGVLSRDFVHIPDIYGKTLYSHQEKAVRKAVSGRNIVVTTGTGSGKTECFLIPIIESLMREKEAKGRIEPGVRALLIYPMNALANDQMDRLRKSLADYPFITFGSYTGQTVEETGKALNVYRKRRGGDENARPLPNELVSRRQMKETPPHILITNYAMLEYLMLRPEDSVFFDGEYAGSWKYIVLDEAHTYSGSTGIEVSMLLKRVLAKLGNPDVQFILTSATLGGKSMNGDIVRFAGNLTGAAFREADIVRADRVNLSGLEKDIDLNISFYEEISRCLGQGMRDDLILSRARKILAEEYNYAVKGICADLSEFLYMLLLRDNTYWDVKRFLRDPQTVGDVCRLMKWNRDELSAFVETASYAVKDRTKLFDARYHLFLRAADGVYVTLPPHKSVSLERMESCEFEGESYAVFEIVTCTQCHAIYILGHIDEKTGRLVQKSGYEGDTIREAFYIGDKVHNDDIDTDLKSEDLDTHEYKLCPCCGFIMDTSRVHKERCEHDPARYISLQKVRTSKVTGRVTKCICCEGTDTRGILRPFFSGQEASTSVVGTALFEILPQHETEIKGALEGGNGYIDVTGSDEGFDDGFDDGFGGFDSGFDDGFGETLDDGLERMEVKEGPGDDFDMGPADAAAYDSAGAKQFLAFSDNRQAAAYYASYFSETYDDILYGRLINEKLGRDGGSVSAARFAAELAVDFRNYSITPFGTESPDYAAEAWKAVLKELVDNKQRNSLIGLGIAGIDTADVFVPMDNKKYRLSAEDVKNICLVFVMGMLSDNAIAYDKALTPDDMEFFSHNGAERTYLLKGSSSRTAVSFLPRQDDKTNKRTDYLKRVLEAKGVPATDGDVMRLLEAFWNRFLMPGSRCSGLLKNVSAKGGGNGYKVDTNLIKFTKYRQWYWCSKCRRFTPYNVAGVCPGYECEGTLEPVDIEQMNGGNHYFRLYNDLDIRPLRVVEHTAQLSSEKAEEYQNKFKEKKIDVLSCSTTFELGVDIGDLETVFMRNMPPSPSNYTQRAGRAGRSLKSAAFVVTFCNKSNHDFTFFKNPNAMMKGEIKPPIFKTDNEKICIRHVYASALSFFWKLHPEYFRYASLMMEGDPQAGLPSGYSLFREYLESRPPELKDYLERCVPEPLQETFDIEGFGWTRWLFDGPDINYPNFKAVYDLYTDEISSLNEAREKLEEKNLRTDYLKDRIRTYRREQGISFLSKHSILPKYGFPVDTVELALNSQTESKYGIELSRDLSMAIAEYAPGCQVVANDRLITSRYIRKMPTGHWRMYDYVMCPLCQTLNLAINTENVIKDDLLECRCCHHPFKPQERRTFLVPEFGFIAESKVEKPTLIKPERAFRAEPSFVSYNNDIIGNTYAINGEDVKVAMVSNGQMAILVSEDFYVCRKCGYALNTFEAGAFTRKMEKEHKAPSGRTCDGTLTKYSLGYRFETDVIKIRMDRPCTYQAAFSVLQALILAACDVLNIDNNEINGCLQAEEYYSGLYGFVLYDVTPGGAGHVRRLDDESVLAQVLTQAYDRAARCTCGAPNGDMSCYSCLRTYQNQRYHDIIKRRYVTDYLQFASSGRTTAFLNESAAAGLPE